MKIISPFKDYYDGVQSYGMDATCVFERKSSKVEINLLDDFLDFCKEFKDYGQTITFQKKGTPNYYDNRIILAHIIVGFCGQLYFGYKFDTIEKGNPAASNTFYSLDKAEVFLSSKVNNYLIEGLILRKTAIIFFEKAAWFHFIKSPIFMFPHYAYDANKVSLDWSQDIPTSPKELLVNPSLKQLDFQLVKDAYSCFQEINQFISGVLSDNENKANILTDKERVQQHGIDLKYRFRTRPKKKT